MTGNVNEFVLSLYRAAKRLPHPSLRHWIFAEMKQLVHFDSALRFRWSECGAGPPMQACHAWGQSDRQLDEYLALELWRDDIVHSVRPPNDRPWSIRASCAECGSERLRRFRKHYGQAHALASWVPTDVATVFDGVALHRAEAGRPFSDDDAARIEQLMPHVADAWRESWLRELARSASSEPGFDGFSIAVLMQDLTMSEAQGDFAELLQLEWPRWRGPMLPADLKTHLEAISPKPWSGKSITVYLRHQPDGTLLLLARRAHRLDAIAPRKREVALLFSRGASQTQIARQLQLSPSTVNNYIGLVYEALALRDKTDLSRLVVRLEP